MKFNTQTYKGKEYQILEILGEGVYGHVLKAKRGNKLYAIKILKKNNKEDFLIEKIILESMKEALNGCKKGILCYEDAFEEDGNFIFITKFVDGMSLDHFIHQKLTLPEDLQPMLTNLMTAYKTIYDIGIVHRDIKPTNILLNPRTLEVTLVDFGFGCFGDSFSIHDTLERKIEAYSDELNTDLMNPLECQGLKGSPMFMSPEYVKKGYATPEADIFSLGIVFFFILTEGNDWIYRGSKNKKILEFYKYIQNEHNRISIASKLAVKGVHNKLFVKAQAISLIQDMLNINPRLRPTPNEILERIPLLFKAPRAAKRKRGN